MGSLSAPRRHPSAPRASESLPEYLPNVVGNGTPYESTRMLAALDPYAPLFDEVRAERERIRDLRKAVAA